MKESTIECLVDFICDNITDKENENLSELVLTEKLKKRLIFEYEFSDGLMNNICESIFWAIKNSKR